MASRFSPKNRGFVYRYAEPSCDSVFVVRSKNLVSVWHRAVVKFNAGQVSPNTKWPAVQISFLKRIKGKY